MSNPLVSLKNILKKHSAGYRISQVKAIDGQKLTTETETGIILTIWGSANLYDWVISKGDQVLGKISAKDTQVVYVP